MYPTWLNRSTLLFESIGARSFGDEWHSPDPQRVGVIELNIISGAAHLRVANARMPIAMFGTESFACVFDRGSNDMLIAHAAHGDTIVRDGWNWSFLSHVGLDRTGRLLVMQGAPEGQAAGIWVYDLDTGEHRFVGNGFHPKWNPNCDAIAFVSVAILSPAEPLKSTLVEYEFATGHTDSLHVFGSGEGGGDICYSEDGADIAFFYESISTTRPGIYIYSRSDDSIRLVVADRLGKGLAWQGAQIVYSNACIDLEDDACGTLWIVDSETGEQRQLTTRLQFVDMPVE